MNYVCQGDDVDIRGEARDVDGAPVDITGATLFCAARLGSVSQPSDSFAITDGAAGAYRVRFRSSTTAAMTPGSWAYDIRARLPTGEIVTVGSGVIPLRAAKTPTP